MSWLQVFPQMPPAYEARHLCPAHYLGSLTAAVRTHTFTGCKYNQVNSHFHCIREGCQFSFLLKHQMTSHARKHMRRMLGKNFDRVPPSQVRPSRMAPLSFLLGVVPCYP